MRKLLLGLLTILLAVAIWFQWKGLQSRDGEKKNESTRIVSLSPAMTENLFALGLGEYIVGTTTFSDYPEAAKSIPTIGDYAKPQIEKILSLRPTLVVGGKEGLDEISADLKQAQIPTLLFATKEVSDFDFLIKSLGDALGAEKTASEVLKDWTLSWRLLEDFKTHNTHPKNVMLLLDIDPVVAAGGGTFLNEILFRCGHRNAFSHLQGYPRIARESLFSPALDVFVGMLMIRDRKIENLFQQLTQEITRHSQNAKTFLLDGAPYSRLTPRLAKSALQLCETISQNKNPQEPSP